MTNVPEQTGMEPNETVNAVAVVEPPIKISDSDSGAHGAFVRDGENTLTKSPANGLSESLPYVGSFYRFSSGPRADHRA